MAKDKGKHSRPGDVLVDDMEKNAVGWQGDFILHTSAPSSLQRLKELGYEMTAGV